MRLARLATRYPRTTLLLHLLLALGALGGVRKLRQTDDLLQFLPQGNPEVQAFREVSRTFGALQLAVVGVEAPAGSDVFAPEVVKRLAATSGALKQVHGVDRVVSLTTLPDFVPSDAMVQVMPLIERPPHDRSEQAALRAKVMSRSHVVGNFVARDASASLMLVYLAQGASVRVVAREIRATCERVLGGLHAVYGGAPFAEATIYDETEADLRHLTPLAALLILGVIILAFRDPLGVALTLITVAWASLLVLGAMGFLGEPYTVVSGTLPVILFASGSSYAVHLLGRYYSDGGGDREALLRAADVVGPPVAIAGWTTAAGFFSFLAMDIHPMRAFGLECALGVLGCLVASMALVPAVIALFPRSSGRPINTGGLGEYLARLTHWARRHRIAVVMVAVALGCATVGPMLRVEVRMEPRAFFSPGSDPWNAERFLEEKFGGAQFLQVEVQGEMTDPATLMELERLAGFARAQKGVTQVASIIEPLTLVNQAMGGGRRLPESRAQASNLLFFVEGEPSLRNVLAEGRDRALVHIRIRGDAAPAVAAIEDYIAHALHRQPVAPTAAEVSERLRWMTSAPPRTLERVLVAMAQAPDAVLLRAATEKAIDQLLAGEGGFLPPVDPSRRPEIATALRVGGDRKATLARVAPSLEEGGLAADALEDRLHEARRHLQEDTALRALPGEHSADARESLRATLGMLLPRHPIAAAPRSVVARLAGGPILDRGFARSVAHNQERSLIVSLAAVVLLMFVLFRSAYLAVVSMIPSVLWMATVFGYMSLAHIPIDISTSLVASIATGAGSDFAMHYLWYFRKRSPDEAVRFVGPVMVISALLVSAGFAVLGLGRSQPMRMFGLMAGLSMAGAFALTFLLVPALLRKVDLPTGDNR